MPPLGAAVVVLVLGGEVVVWVAGGLGAAEVVVAVVVVAGVAGAGGGVLAAGAVTVSRAALAAWARRAWCARRRWCLLAWCVRECALVVAVAAAGGALATGLAFEVPPHPAMASAATMGTAIRATWRRCLMSMGWLRSRSGMVCLSRRSG